MKFVSSIYGATPYLPHFVCVVAASIMPSMAKFAPDMKAELRVVITALKATLGSLYRIRKLARETLKRGLVIKRQ
jgi:hypothetical protein